MHIHKKNKQTRKQLSNPIESGKIFRPGYSSQMLADLIKELLPEFDKKREKELRQKLEEEQNDFKHIEESFATGDESLPNAMNSDYKRLTGKEDTPYYWATKVPYFKGRKVIDVKVDPLPRFGLSCSLSPDKKQIEISGIVKIEEDFREPKKIPITFKFVLSDRDDINSRRYYQKLELCQDIFGRISKNNLFEIKKDLIVAQRPCNLWLDINPSETEDYYKSKETFDIIDDKKDAKVVAISVRGRSHAHKGLFRDDDFSIAYDEDNECFLLAVGDGAGSAKFSRQGSKIACHSVIEALKGTESPLKKITNEDVDSWISNQDNPQAELEENEKKVQIEKWMKVAVIKAFEDIKEEALNKGEKISSYATTLLMVVAKKIENNWLIASYWIGDGAIAMYDKRKARSILYLLGRGEPDEGRYSGETKFLTMEDEYLHPENRFDVKIATDLTAIFLMTDGISDPKFGSYENLNSFECWDNLWENELKPLLQDQGDENKERLEEKLIRWAKFYQEGEHDDRTMAILINRE